MCGIFYYKGKLYTHEELYPWFMKTQHRGPDRSKVHTQNDQYFGFHRLKINGLDELSDQPMLFEDCV